MEWIGAAAATCTTLCFVPQAMKIVREKNTQSISLGMYALFTLGVALWFVYGIQLDSWPMICSNGVTFLLSGYILWAKLRFK